VIFQIGPLNAPYGGYSVLMEPAEGNATRSAVAAVIRAERGRADMTQDVLAERAGLSKSTIVRLEAGKRDMDMDQARRIAGVFGHRASWLLLQVENSQPVADTTDIPPAQLAKLDQLSAARKKRVTPKESTPVHKSDN
jgi:transcriptional regulator with XRE-family HTH domain